MTRTALVLVLATAGFACQANAVELLSNGGFESEPNWGGGISHDGGYTAFTGTDIPGWIVADGHAATIHNHVYPWISGSYSLNTDGEGYNSHNVDIYQDFTPDAGSLNTLTYAWKVWYINAVPRLDVSVTDLTDSSVLYHGNFGQPDLLLHNESSNFVGNGHTLRLEIKESPETGLNDNAFIADDFSVQSEAVPEPFSIVGLALAGALAARRRKA